MGRPALATPPWPLAGLPTNKTAHQTPPPIGAHRRPRSLLTSSKAGHSAMASPKPATPGPLPRAPLEVGTTISARLAPFYKLWHDATVAAASLR